MHKPILMLMLNIICLGFTLLALIDRHNLVKQTNDIVWAILAQAFLLELIDE